MFQKIISFVLIFSPLLLSAQHTIKGQIKGNSGDFKIYLKELTNYKSIVLDSIVTQNNTFQFIIPDNDKLIYLYSEKYPNLNIKLYNLKGTTEIKYNSTNDTYTVKGASKNEGLTNYERFIKPYYTKLAELSKQKPKIANKENFTIEERNEYQKHYLLEKSAKNNIELAKFDFIEKNKKNDYTQILINEKLNSVFEEVNYNLLENFYNGLTEIDKKSVNGEKLAAFLKEYKQVIIGAKVADFTLLDHTNTPQTLYKNLGKYTILDFWASWCAPCRSENPNTVALYKKYQNKGLKIIGISLDTDKEKWISAVEKDHLTWLQLSNLKGWKEPLLQNFKITSIPKLVILDKNGVIIAKDLRGEELSNKIEELFNKK